MQSVVSGLMTTFHEQGKGNTVVLIHGWGDQHKTFNSLTNELSNEYHIVALDLPGFGGTQAPDTVWGLQEYATFVSDFIKKQNINPYAIVAHSNGGAVAIKGIALGILTPKKLVLLASAGIRDREKAIRFFVKIVAKIGKVATFWLPKSTKRKLQKKLYGAAGSDMLVVPHLQETFKKTVRQDVQQDAKKVHIPTLLLYGQEDKATPPLFGEIYSKLIPNAEFKVIPQAGHFIHHEKVSEVSKYTREFFRE